MTIERIVELEQFIEREIKGNEALTNDAGCVARAKIDRDILACLKELKDYREAWDKVDENIVARHSEASYRHIDENCFCGIYNALHIVRKLRPKDSKKECDTCYYGGELLLGYGDNCYNPCDGCKENGYRNYKKEE